MNKVKRFNSEFRGMIERPNGQFVFSADYYAVKAERDALAAENVAIKAKVAIHAAGFSVCPVCSHEEPSETDDIVWMVNETPTPATDAYINSVRADVIKQLHSEQKEWALVTWQYDSFEALKRAAVRHGDSELSGVIFMLDRIEGFAAQLRAGEPS